MKSLLRALLFLHLLTLTLAGCKQWVMKLPQAIHRYPFVRVTSVKLVNPSTPVPVANLRACHSVCDKAGCKAFAFYYDQLLCSISEAYQEDGPRILTPDAVQARKDLGFYVAVPHDEDKMPYCPSRETYGRYLAQDVLPWLFPDPTTTPALPIAASSSARTSSSTAPKDTTATQTSSSPTASSSSKATTPSGAGLSSEETRNSTSSAPSTPWAPAATSGSAAGALSGTSTTASGSQTRPSSTTTEESVSSPSPLTSSQSTAEADTSELPVDETSTRAKTTSGEASSTPAPLSTSTTTTTQMPPSIVTTTTVTETPSTSTTTVGQWSEGGHESTGSSDSHETSGPPGGKQTQVTGVSIDLKTAAAAVTSTSTTTTATSGSLTTSGPKIAGSLSVNDEEFEVKAGVDFLQDHLGRQQRFRKSSKKEVEVAVQPDCTLFLEMMPSDGGASKNVTYPNVGGDHAKSFPVSMTGYSGISTVYGMC